MQLDLSMIIYSFFEYLLLTYVGLRLLGIKILLLNYFKIAAINTTILFLIRHIINSQGLHLLITFLILATTLKLIARINLKTAIICSLVGYVLLTLGELLFLYFFQEVFNISLNLLFQNWKLYFLAYLTTKIPLLIASLLIYKVNFEIVNLNQNHKNNILSNEFNIQNTIIILLIQSFLLIIAIKGNIIKNHFFRNKYLLYSTLFLATTLSISSILLIGKLYIVIKHESELKLKQHQLNHKEKLLRELKSQKHDFSNHLQTIYGMSQLNKTEEIKKYIQSLTTDLQNIELNSKKDITIFDFSLLPLEKKALKQNINIESNIDKGFEAINCSTDKLNRILSNLVKNAIEAMQELKGTKQIKVEGNNQNDQYILSVYNNKPIIRQELLQQIFEPGKSTKGEDRGFGLYIIKSLTEQAGGKLTATSEQNFGTKFTCYFPKKRNFNS